MARYLALWIYNVYVLLNINCYVFGGGLLNLGDRLFPKVRAYFDQYNDNDAPVYFRHLSCTVFSALLGCPGR